MDGKPTDKWRLKSIIQEVESRLEGADCPFCKEAKTLVRKKISRYSKELISASKKLAKKDRLEGVSATHVEQASNTIFNGPTTGFCRRFAQLGSAFLGASVTILFPMIQGSNYSGGGVITALVFGIVGAFLLALDIGNGS